MKRGEVFQAIIAIIILLFLVNSLIPFLTGSMKPLVVLSGSMTPIMLPGDMIIVKSINPDEIVRGDIIAFKDPGGKDTFVTHRVINIEGNKDRIFKTKGDANEDEDNFNVVPSNIIGRLVFVFPFIGYLSDNSKNKIFFLVTVLIPAFLLILGEIRTLIIYSNPIRAHKFEFNKKRTLKYSSHVIKVKRLVTITLIIGFVLTGIVMGDLEKSGPIHLQEKNTIRNSGLLSSTYVFIAQNFSESSSIKPWYGVIPPSNETEINAPKNTSAVISSTPYILPVFWTISLAQINPYFPAVAGVLLYTFIFTLFLSPLWYCKKRLRKAKKLKLKYLLIQWRKLFHLNKVT